MAEVDLDDTVALGGLEVIDTKPAERDRRPRWVQTSLGHQVTDGKVRRDWVTQSSQVGSLPALFGGPSLPRQLRQPRNLRAGAADYLIGKTIQRMAICSI